jgi:hypothetical protein
MVVDPEELVELSTLEIKGDYPTQNEIARLLDAEQYDDVEFDEKDDD